MKPIDFPQANDLLRAAPGTEESVVDLPVARIQYLDGTPGIVSCWRLSFWERLKVLWTGNVYFEALARTHPPILLTVDPPPIPKRNGPLPVNERRGPPVHPNCKCKLNEEFPPRLPSEMATIVFKGGPMDAHVETNIPVVNNPFTYFFNQGKFSVYVLDDQDCQGRLVFGYRGTFDLSDFPEGQKKDYPSQFPEAR